MPKAILTVDDSPTMRQMVRLTLSSAGYVVAEASSGEAALEACATQTFDVVVTDLNMPEMDGLELIRQLRARPQYKFIPILMLTTDSQLDKKSEGKAAGASGWIVKPFTPEQLVAVIKKVCRS
jgi:two-component system chemotaxis response regulator CheY